MTNIHKTGDDIEVKAEISLLRREALAGTICEVLADVIDGPAPARTLICRRLVLDSDGGMVVPDMDLETEAESMVEEIGRALFKERILEAMKKARHGK